jgi:hypothetical protein
MSTVNVESKNHLARLLATENIYIRHKNVKTASFNTVTRVLMFPIWKDMSDELYTMLAGHEVGHALWTVRERLDIVAKQVDPNNIKIAASYVNIVEDVRIERLMKGRYPGLKLPFRSAYAELFDKDFFGTSQGDANQRCFIDRANLYFKVGTHVPTLTFTDEEKLFLTKIEKAETSNDVLAISKEIYDWAKKNNQHPEPTDLTDEELEELKRQIENGEVELEEADEDYDGPTIEMEMEMEGDEGEESDDENRQKKGFKSGTNGQKLGKIKVKRKFKRQLPVDPDGEAPEPTTQDHFDHQIEDFTDKKADNVVYVSLPTPILENILVDHKDVHEKIRRHFCLMDITKAEAAFGQFQEANDRKIKYIHNEFEMRKQADRYKRTKTHKTGALDTLRLHSYKYDDTIFKTVATSCDGRNHGLLFVIDWSGSMSQSMAGTIEQLILLCMFCRKAGIPFEAYSLTTGGRDAFQMNPGNLYYSSNFRMRNYLSSRMTQSQFYEACVNLFALMPNGYFQGGPVEDHLIGCTPLDESIISTMELMNRFRRTTGAQIVNAVFLTDGDANTVSGYLSDSGSRQYFEPKTTYLIEDRALHKTYEFRPDTMTQVMLRILRDRQNIHVVGFFIGGSYEHFFDKDKMTSESKKQLAESFKEKGYVISKDWGYNELYIIKDGGTLRVKNPELKPKAAIGTEKYGEALLKSFQEQSGSLMKERILLNSFVQMIA